MLLNINDTILYGTHGVCKVIDKNPRSFFGQKHYYYTLKPLYDNVSAIYIPENLEKISNKIRRLLSPNEIYELIKSIPNKKTIDVPDEITRKEVYKNIILNSNRSDLISLIKTIYLRKQEKEADGKKLSTTEQQFMKEAENILYEEFSYVLHIKKDEVLPFIREQI